MGEERTNGRLQALEPSNIQAQKPILDPLRIYSGMETNDSIDLSDSLPFLPRPAHLDGTMAGDVGFDPFNFAAGDDAQELYTMREAEVKPLAGDYGFDPFSFYPKDNAGQE